LTRRRISSSEGSIPASSSTARRDGRAGRSKTAVTSPCAAPCAHQIGPAAPAQHEAQTVQQDRLAGPGLAGQHVQARLEIKSSRSISSMSRMSSERSIAPPVGRQGPYSHLP
jgi:hypothetical protein